MGARTASRVPPFMCTIRADVVFHRPRGATVIPRVGRWHRQDSNLQPLAFQTNALSSWSYNAMVGTEGIEPPTSPVSGVRSNRTELRPIVVSADGRSRVCDLRLRGRCSSLSYISGLRTGGKPVRFQQVAVKRPSGEAPERRRDRSEDVNGSKSVCVREPHRPAVG